MSNNKKLNRDTRPERIDFYTLYFLLKNGRERINEMDEMYLNKEIYGEDIRRFCMRVDEPRVFLFKNLRTRLANLIVSYEQLLPKFLEAHIFMETYHDMVKKYDKVFNVFQYGLKYMNQLIAMGEKDVINDWFEALKAFKEVYYFLEYQEEPLKRKCLLAWNEGFCNLVEEGELSPYYPIVATKLSNEFWYTEVTVPMVTAHVIQEETLKSLKANTAGLMYKIATENLITMSPVYGEYEVQKNEGREKCFQLSEIEKMLSWPDVNSYYNFNFCIGEHDRFYTPENFIQQAKESSGEGVNQFGLGKILLRNDMKYLYGIFYSEDSTEDFKGKVRGFSQAFGLHVFEVGKDGTLSQVRKTSRTFW